MTTIWRNGHFYPPSVEYFLEEFIDDLQGGRSLFIVLPDGTRPSELKNALAQRLDVLERHVITLRLCDIESVTQAIEELAEHLQVKWEPARTPRTVENLLRLRMAQYADEEIVLFLEGFDRGDDDACQIWLEILTRWSNTTHTIANTAKPLAALCVIAQASRLLPFLPTNMLYLQVRWWWGVPSRIEVQLYCQSFATSGDEMEEKLWREYLLPHLVGDDVTLLHYLWDKLFGKPEEILAALAPYAESHWLDCEDIQAEFAAHKLNERHFLKKLQSEPPNPLRSLWAKGVVSATAEHGIELHSAIAAKLGHDQAIYHRLWRGQAALLLPLLDQARLTLCMVFTQKYGRDWPLRWGAIPTPDEEAALRENPLACEWRYLRDLLNYYQPPREVCQYASLTRQALSLRNRLAHYKPVPYADFQSFWREQSLLADLSIMPDESIRHTVKWRQ